MIIEGAKQYRMEIGYELLMLLEKFEELPLPNRQRLCKIMNEYYVKEGIADIIKDDGYTWRPNVDYWMNHLSCLCSYMRENYKIYFSFVRDDGKLTGVWKFVNKGEWEKSLKTNHNDIMTRTENHNEKIDDTSLRWKTDIPRIEIEDVKRLT